MPDSDIQRLVERIEGASGPDREIDLAIAKYVGRVPVGATYDTFESMAWHNRLAYTLPFYTQSCDSALTLVPQGWIVEIRRYFNSDGEYVAAVDLTDGGTVGRGCHPEEELTVQSRIVEQRQGHDPTPSAITAAALRARITERTDDDA